MTGPRLEVRGPKSEKSTVIGSDVVLKLVALASPHPKKGSLSSGLIDDPPPPSLENL